MIFKKKEFFLLIFLMFLQSCSGGSIGNFLESSFDDLEKTSQNEDVQDNLANKKIKKVEKPRNVAENKKDINLEKENKEIDDKKIKKIKKIKKNKKNKKNKKIKKVEKPRNVAENKKDINLEKTSQNEDLQNNLVNKKIKSYSKKRKTELQSYKIIFILKDVDPKDPTKDLSTILKNSEVNFEIEKIERLLDSENKSYE